MPESVTPPAAVPRHPAIFGTMEQQGTLIILETAKHRVKGNLRLPRDGYRSRLTDYLNAPEQRFLPLTDAEITPLDGSGGSARHAFMLLAIREIITARPADASHQE
jgi:hypothetical protein